MGLDPLLADYTIAQPEYASSLGRVLHTVACSAPGGRETRTNWEAVAGGAGVDCGSRLIFRSIDGVQPECESALLGPVDTALEYIL